MTDTTNLSTWLDDYLSDDGTIDPQMPLCAAGNALLDYRVRRDEFGPEGPDGATVEAIRQEAEVAALKALAVERERLARAGLLLPEGGTLRTEHEVEWRPVGRLRGGVEQVAYWDLDEAALSAEVEAAARLGREMVSHRWREVRTWGDVIPVSDGPRYTGPWVEVEQDETKGAAA